jgi:MATE family multidrug resistance protein
MLSLCCLLFFHQKARETAWLTVFVATAFMCCIFVIELATRSMLGRIFTDEDDVVEMVDRTLLLCVLMQMFDGMQGVLSGVLRGCGLQKTGTVGCVVGFSTLGQHRLFVFVLACVTFTLVFCHVDV